MIWGTVTAVSPLRVKLDGDTTALPFEPDSLVDPAALAVNDRVRCELSKRRVVIVGRSGGTRATPLTDFEPIWTNLTVGNGTTVASGSVSGGLLVFDAQVTLGTTSAISNTVGIDLPWGLSMSGINGRTHLGGGTFHDVSAGSELALILGAATFTRLNLKVLDASGTYALRQNTSPSAPVSYAAGDTLMVHAYVAVQ